MEENKRNFNNYKLCSLMLIGLLIALPGTSFSKIISASPPDTSSLILKEDFFQNFSQHEQLQPIVRLFKEGNKDKARLAIALHLKRFPNDILALELAGTMLLEDKKYIPAATAFRRIVVEHRGHIDVWLKMGIALILAGDYQKGTRSLKQVLSLEPNNVIALRYLSWTAQKNNQIPLAIDYLQKLTQISSKKSHDVTPYHLALARIYYTQQNYPAVYNLLNKRKLDDDLKNPYHANIAMLLANAQLKLNKHEEAMQTYRLLENVYAQEADVKLLKILLDRNPDNFNTTEKNLLALLKKYPSQSNTLRYELAQTYALYGKNEQAVKTLKQLAQSAKGSSLFSLIKNMVAVYSSNKQYNKAIALLKDYHSKNPEMLELSYLIAEVNVLKGDNKNALSILERLIKEKPHFIPAYQLASHISKTNDPRQSEKYLKQAVDNNLSQDHVWISLANFYFNLDSLKKAEQTLREGAKLNPKSMTLKFELASALQEQGKIKEANKNYRLLLVTDPSHYAALHNLLSNLVQHKSGYKEALSIGKIMYARGLTEPSILGAYGSVLLHTGDYSQATIVLEKATQSISDNYIVKEPKEAANIFFLSGQAYLKNKQNDKAKQAFRRAVELGISKEDKQSIAQYL